MALTFGMGEAGDLELLGSRGIAEQHYGSGQRSVWPIEDHFGAESSRPLFEEAGHDVKFWIGTVAVGDMALRPVENAKTRQLRAAVYVEEMGWLDESHLADDGGEHDEDDARSIHFGIVERGQNGQEDQARGTLRLIMKQDEHGLLPAERFFPEVFTNDPAPVKSVEASRYISRHEDKVTQQAIFMAEIRCMVLQAAEMDIPYIYAVIEEQFARNLRILRLPYERMSETRYLDDYKTENFAIRIDPKEVIRSALSNDRPSARLLELIRLGGSGQGVGLYDESFTENYKGVGEYGQPSFRSAA